MTKSVIFSIVLSFLTDSLISFIFIFTVSSVVTKSIASFKVSAEIFLKFNLLPIPNVSNLQPLSC